MNYKNTILITGAAGGFGKALVDMAVALPDIDKVIATDISSNIGELYNYLPDVMGLVMDATSEDSIKDVRAILHKENLRVKYIINNAGVFMFHPVSEMTEELLTRIMKINSFAPVLTVSVFLDDLIKSKGMVVQISSCGVKFPTMFQSYPASKIAMEALSVSMRQELELVGVKMIFIRSGAINTGLISEMKKLPVPAEESSYESFYKRYLNNVQKSVGKVIEPEEVAKVVGRAFTDSKPKNIYTLNRNTTIRILSLFPQKIQDMLLKQMVKK
jgi:short-subunit dehydrogenase